MTENQRRRWAQLVGKGYFPEELPPCFHSEDLIAFIEDEDFEVGRYQHASDNAMPYASKILPFSIPHVRGYRRLLGIPGPFHYTELAHTLVINSQAIADIIAESEISIFKDYDPDNDRRYIAKPDFKAFTEQRILRSTGYRYLLSVDVSRFYASIYTHSLPWAVHGKDFAKGHRQPVHFGNLLDTQARNCQDAQTMGLPTGPDSSRILSEIILARVDKKLQEELPHLEGIRNVDDYLLYFETYADAEKARTILQRSLREYELELNVAKEKIVELPDIIETEWKTTIRSFRFRKNDELQRADLITFFDLVTRIVRHYPDEVILTYAIAKLRGLRVRRPNWEIFQAFLLNSLVLESRVIVQVAYLLLHIRDSRGFSLNKPMITRALKSFVEFHAEHDHHFELVWVLWFYQQCQWKLPRTSGEILNKSLNDFVILLLLQLEKEGLIQGSLDKTLWIQFLNAEHLVSEHWLLAYEGAASNFFPSRRRHLGRIEFFNEMAHSGVHFFKIEEEAEEDERVDDPKSSLAKEVEAGEDTEEDDGPDLSDIYDITDD